MRPSAAARSALSFIGFVLMFGGLVGLFRRGALFSSSVVVIVLQLIAVLIMIWARVTFGIRSYHATATPTEGGLVTTGPYRYIRHPIYSSICLFAWASCLGHLSSFSARLALVVTVGAAVRMAMEEALLVERYPDYAAYASRTKRVVPFLF
jgi:protein-S-isoprenylcysteine O-methyltransferase Ste14